MEANAIFMAYTVARVGRLLANDISIPREAGHDGESGG